MFEERALRVRFLSSGIQYGVIGRPVTDVSKAAGPSSSRVKLSNENATSSAVRENYLTQSLISSCMKNIILISFFWRLMISSASLQACLSAKY